MVELKNTDPKMVQDIIHSVTNLFIQFGWYILLVIIASVYVYHKYASKILNRNRYENPDPEVLMNRAEQMEMVRRRQQELYDKQLDEFKRKETEKLNQKKSEIKELEKTVEKTSDLRKRSSKPLRDNSFNPLMGSTSGTTYRPSRSCGPAGGG